MIEVRGLTKRYEGRTVVDDVSFTVRPGMVTGFLGPNGAGKSTTMRMMVGLASPTAGTATVNGKPYSQHRTPLAEVGALLDAGSVHPGRTARDHLLALAKSHSITPSRVDEVIEATGLRGVARRRAGRFSLGMGQRLGLAAALLGDPRTLILDEPINGLDPDGVVWVRTLLRGLAAEGRTVFLSSHLMSEMALTADHLIVLGRGRVIADAPTTSVVAQAQTSTVRVRTPMIDELRGVLQRAPGVAATQVDHDVLDVTGSTAPDIAATAAAAGVVLHEISPLRVSLEDAYMKLTASAVEYRATTVPSTSSTEIHHTAGGHR